MKPARARHELCDAVLSLISREGSKFGRLEPGRVRIIKDAEKYCGPVWASEKDPRVTKVGSILRATAMDELPQYPPRQMGAEGEEVLKLTNRLLRWQREFLILLEEFLKEEYYRSMEEK